MTHNRRHTRERRDDNVGIGQLLPMVSRWDAIYPCSGGVGGAKAGRCVLKDQPGARIESQGGRSGEIRLRIGLHATQELRHRKLKSKSKDFQGSETRLLPASLDGST